jgi:hypothetical protein
VRGVVEKVFTRPGEEERAAYETHLSEGSGYICEAVGYARGALPALSVDGQRVDEKNVRGDGRTGQLAQVSAKGDSAPLPGLRGIGIAFPETVTDPKGNVEASVGMWKFMRYLKEVVPGWVAEAKAAK